MAQFDFLNTGNTGNTSVTETFGNEDTSPEVDEAIQSQRLEAQTLLPSIKAILATLDAEIAAVSDIRAYMKTLGPKPSKAAIEAEYRGRELFIERVENLKLNITNKVTDYEGSNG